MIIARLTPNDNGTIPIPPTGKVVGDVFLDVDFEAAKYAYKCRITHSKVVAVCEFLRKYPFTISAAKTLIKQKVPTLGHIIST